MRDNTQMKLAVCAVLTLSIAFAADQKLGAPLTAKEAMPLPALFANPTPLVGKTVQVKGKVTEVCQAMGCWMNIVFPQDSVGKTAIAEGKLEKFDMTREEVIAAAQEEAADSGRKFDPSSVKSGKTVYQLAGTGALIFDK